MANIIIQTTLAQVANSLQSEGMRGKSILEVFSGHFTVIFSVTFTVTFTVNQR